MREDYYSRNGSGTFPLTHLMKDRVATSAHPPAHGEWSGHTTDRYHRWDPRGWSWKKKLVLAFGVIVALVVIIVGVSLGMRAHHYAHHYPDYSKLNYSLKDNFSGSSFFDNFEYFNAPDPTHGFVHYIDRAASESLNLTSATDTSAVLKVDTTEGKEEAVKGRKSVRVTSKKTYANGLFIFDVIHTPYGCGTWPALWLTDPNNWPHNGEIDIVEAANAGVFGTQSTLHTSKGCTMDVIRKESGTVDSEDCYYEANGWIGCGVKGNSATYGPELNKQGGGVYAMELRDDGIRVWQWGRSRVPSDITSGSPDPSTWGQAFADFPNTKCNIGSHFKNQSIIINISLCGDMAGTTESYIDDSHCPGECNQFVRDNAASFKTAYWEFNSVKVYQA